MISTSVHIFLGINITMETDLLFVKMFLQGIHNVISNRDKCLVFFGFQFSMCKEMQRSSAGQTTEQNLLYYEVKTTQVDVSVQYEDDGQCHCSLMTCSILQFS